MNVMTPNAAAGSSAQAGPASAGLLDLARLEQRIGRNADLLRELVSLFLSAQPKDIRSLRQAIDAGDAAPTVKLSHHIAGSFATLTMEQLARDALQIEEHAAAGRLDTCKVLLIELETQFEAVKLQLGGLLTRLATPLPDKGTDPRR